uniref:Uncharacterized protein n=1 Tax=Clandestinovirus TaxID=2831644 RepID=A0A8F8PK69_9VIRU|nr:hypothetical protein KOM_12_445 [Clandestinovirus]
MDTESVIIELPASGKFLDVTSMVTTNQQFLASTICSALLLVASVLIPTGSYTQGLSNMFNLCALLCSFSLYMLSNALFEVVGYKWAIVHDKYNHLAFATAISSFLGLLFFTASVLPLHLQVPVFVIAAYSFYLFIKLKQYK